jgi:hypothetical protein
MGDDEGLLWDIKQEDTEDELFIFAGHTRFVSGKTFSWSNNNDQPVYGPPPVPQSFHHTEIEPAPQAHPPSSDAGNSCVVALPEHGTTRQTGDFMSLSPGYSVQCPYIRSECTHQIETSLPLPSASHRWSNQPPHRLQDLPPEISDLETNRYLHPSTGLSGISGYDVQYQSQLQRPLMSAPLPSQRHHSQYHPLQLPQHSPQQPQQYQHQSHERMTPSFALANLGLASRHSRLDTRWRSFMEDSGLLDSFEAQ